MIKINIKWSYNLLGKTGYKYVIFSKSPSFDFKLGFLNPGTESRGSGVTVLWLSVIHIKQYIRVHQLLLPSVWQTAGRQAAVCSCYWRTALVGSHLCNSKHQDAMVSQESHCPAAALRETETLLMNMEPFIGDFKWIPLTRDGGRVYIDLRVETTMLYCWIRLLPIQ